ncbi:MAG: ATP-binding protein [Chloroflexota bacterium]
MFRRIRWRIALPYMVLLGAAMVLLTLYLQGVVRSTYVRNLTERLTGEAELVADLMAEPMGAGQRDGLQALARRLGDQLGVRVTAIAPDGVVWADSLSEPAIMDNHLLRAEVQAALRTGRGSAVRYSATADYDMIYVAVPVTRRNAASQGSVVGAVRLAVPLRATDADLAALSRDSRAGIALAVGLALALAVAIAGRIVSPIRSLTRVVQRMAAGNLSARLLPVSHDEVGQLTEAFSEMAERQRVSLASLSQERAQLAAVLDNMADGVLIASANAVVQLINPAAERILNVPPGTALGRSLAQVVRQHEIIAVWEAAREANSERVELVEVGRQGLFLQVVVTPLSGAEPGTALMILQDLSHVRRLETVRREFVSNISHELRRPLASLKALSETLSDGALEDPDAARPFLQRIDHEVDILTQMTEELLELSRIESGQVPMRLQPIHVRGVVAPVVARLLPQAERANLDLDVELPADLPPVLGDLERLRQVVVNLLHNAIKFTPAGGTIRVAARRAGDEVIVAVSDTGIGITEEALPRIFERLLKGDRSGQGVGLGLAIARQVVHGHGGRIWAESAEGRGSTFCFSLIAADARLTGRLETPARID